jgi:hypothetical protein
LSCFGLTCPLLSFKPVHAKSRRFKMNIQNHFSDTALLSLADLKTRLEQDCKLDAQTARDDIRH